MRWLLYKKRITVVILCLALAGTAFAVGSAGGSSSGSGTAAKQPKTPTAIDLYNSGYAASKIGKYQDAIADFNSAIALNTDFPEAREYYGEAFLRASG